MVVLHNLQAISRVHPARRFNWVCCWELSHFEYLGQQMQSCIVSLYAMYDQQEISSLYRTSLVCQSNLVVLFSRAALVCTARSLHGRRLFRFQHRIARSAVRPKPPVCFRHMRKFIICCHDAWLTSWTSLLRPLQFISYPSRRGAWHVWDHSNLAVPWSCCCAACWKVVALHTFCRWTRRSTGVCGMLHR